jgi:NADH:ubiquinone oxidoreductase subunit F (NADH-binding)
MAPRNATVRTDLDDLIEALEQAGLHGHGGAFFPTATKLRAVAAQRRRPIIVVNGSEGEPLSRKDRFLLATRTETVLDGALAVAGALGADTIVITVDGRRVKTIDAVQRALATRSELGARHAPTVEVVGVPAGFVSGQETALLNFLGGGEAKPTATPPYPFEKGLRGRPTLVSNVETIAQIGRILAGDYDASRWVTVSGAVSQTAVVQVAANTTVAEVLSAAGGVSERVSAVLLGGYGGTWVGVPEAFDLTLEEPALRAQGLTLGAGIVHALGASRCPVTEVAEVARWMAGESAGQCGPCVFGLDAIAQALERLCTDGDRFAPGGAASLAQIRRWCAMVTKRGGCAHPDGVARYVTSAVTVMAAEFEDHAAHGRCERCRVPGRRPAPRGGRPHRDGARAEPAVMA